MKARQLRLGLTIGLALLVSIFGSANLAFSSLNGEYEMMEGEPSLHESGKVILLEFADFYCPHCHMFERVVVTKLQEEFVDKLESRMIGFPVMPGKLPTVFEMYNQAVTMGKGQKMKEVLVLTIHDKDIQMFDKTMRTLIPHELQEEARQVGQFERAAICRAGSRRLNIAGKKSWRRRYPPAPLSSHKPGTPESIGSP